MTRREFEKLMIFGVGGLLLSSCVGDEQTDKPKYTELDMTGRELKSLAGGALNHYLWPNPDFSRYEHFSRDMELLASKEGNLAVIDFNSDLLIKDPDYRDHFLSDIVRTKKYMRIALVLHSRGMRDSTDPMQIDTVDSKLILDWKRIMATPGVAETLAEYVDIINPLSEPVYINDVKGHRRITGAEMKMYSEKIYWEIVQPALGVDVAWATSGVFWGSDLSAFSPSFLPAVPKGLLEVHLYPWNYDKKGHWLKLAEAGVKVIVGEAGYVKDQADLELLAGWLGDCVKLGIPFAAWGMNGMRFHGERGDPRNLILADGSETRVGKVVFAKISEKRDRWG